MTHRRRALVVATLVSAGAAVAAVGTMATAASRSTPSFATPVVVDHWRPGFEPDVAADFHQNSGDRLYTTWPNGFSTTQSFMYRSEDHGESFHPTEGNVAGKALTCAGGGDSEIQVNPHDGALYFADLQGLTNFSNSSSTDGGRTYKTSCTAVPGVGVDRQWISLDTNGGKSSIGSGANDG